MKRSLSLSSCLLSAVAGRGSGAIENEVSTCFVNYRCDDYFPSLKSASRIEWFWYESSSRMNMFGKLARPRWNSSFWNRILANLDAAWKFQRVRPFLSKWTWLILSAVRSFSLFCLSEGRTVCWSMSAFHSWNNPFRVTGLWLTFINFEVFIFCRDVFDVSTTPLL